MGNQEKPQRLTAMAVVPQLQLRKLLNNEGVSTAMAAKLQLQRQKLLHLEGFSTAIAVVVQLQRWS